MARNEGEVAMQELEAGDFETIAEGFSFVEGPRVSPEGDLWFADLSGTGVFRKRSGSAPEEMVPARQWVGGIVFDESGMVLCSGRDGIIAVDPATRATIDVLREIDGEPVIAVNDMEADGRGGFFAGTIDFVSIFETGETPRPGKFFHMSAAGEVTVLRSDVFASNGMARSPCGKWLLHSETSRGIMRYPLDDTGMPGEGEMIVDLPDCDGLVADSAGGFWVACWETGRLLHYDADAQCTTGFTFPQPHVVSLDFSAIDPSWLYVSTGGNQDAPDLGAVLRMRVDVPGVPGGLTKLRMLESRR
ncbi:calcium-binding protein [Novosphingobium marinum]|nr:calcium-binding protein [Novosphingobium marinum]